jgi:hypothetical protein
LSVKGGIALRRPFVKVKELGFLCYITSPVLATRYSHQDQNHRPLRSTSALEKSQRILYHTTSMMIIPSLFILTLGLCASALPSSLAALQARDADPADSITYCSPAENGDQQYYIPCTRTSNPNSEVQFQMPYLVNDTLTDNRFSAHFECYAETVVG